MTEQTQADSQNLSSKQTPPGQINSEEFFS